MMSTRIGKTLRDTLLVLLVLLAVAWVGGQTTGYLRTDAVMSGSMEPSIGVGSEIIGVRVRAVDVGKTVIAVRGDGLHVSHRVIAVVDATHFRAQGDANAAADAEVYSIGPEGVHQVVAVIPMIGRPITWARQHASEVAAGAAALAVRWAVSRAVAWRRTRQVAQVTPGTHRSLAAAN